MSRFLCSDEQAQYIKEHLQHPDGREDACKALNDAYDNLEPVKPAGSRLDALAEFFRLRLGRGVVLPAYRDHREIEVMKSLGIFFDFR